MADETERLTIRILRDIQATQAEHTRAHADHSRQLAEIQETLTLHGMRLQNHSAMFVELGETLQGLATRLQRRDASVNAAIDDLRIRVEALERARQ